jgi:hypothetical protein
MVLPGQREHYDCKGGQENQGESSVQKRQVQHCTKDREQHHSEEQEANDPVLD